MNVRFFAGTKQQYKNIATPNPLALYFCEDTKELFWGSRLLTDGIRVVNTFKDLPDVTEAAEGVVYYVTETRNGYTISPDAAEWLQTIYAPARDVTTVPESEVYNTVTTVGAVRDIAAEIYDEINALEERIANISVGGGDDGITSISFAGYTLEEVNGNFVIDRRCAREALGFILPEGFESKDVEIVTKEYVDNLVKAATGADLSEYAKKADLTGLASEEFVNQKIAELNVDVNLTNYYTKEEVNTLIPDVSNFATKDEIPSVDGLATTSYVDEKIAEINIPKVPTKVSELENDVGYLTQHQDLSDYAKKTDIPNIAGLASEDFVRSEIAKAELNGGEVTEDELANLLANYYNKTEIDDKIKNINIPSIEGLATEEFVNAAIADIKMPEVPSKVSELENDAGFITSADLPKTDLSNYYNKTETEALVNEAISGVIIPDTSNFITMEDVESKGYLTEHQDISHLATKDDIPDVSKFITEIPEEYITAEELAAEGFLKEHQSLEDYAKSKTVVTKKYEVLPIDGMFVQYNDNEVRVNTQHVDINSLPKQEAGDGSSDSYYYMTFRAYAPEGATSVIEGSNDNMDKEHSELATDSYGRKYTTIWAAIANRTGDGWSRFGDRSTVDKYLGFYYNFHWYNEDKLLSKEKVRVILTNDACHNDLVPDAVARRIDEKVAAVNTTVNTLSTTVENIENTYVQNETLENYVTNEYIQTQNYVTNNYITENYTTTEELAATYVTEEKVTEVVTNEVNTVVATQIEEKVTEVIKEKVDAGEINVNADAINYDTWD